MSKLPIFFVDAFTETTFGGNPAGVCLVSSDNASLTDEQLQGIAREINMPATGFIFSDGDDDSFKTRSRFRLRWFTTKEEVKLCGHATLSSTAVLFKKLGNASKEIVFDFSSGTLKVSCQDNLFCMDFPLNPSHKQDRAELEDLLKAIVDSSSRIQDVEYAPTLDMLLVRLSDSCTRSELESIQPQISRMMECKNTLTGKMNGVILTLRGSKSNGAVDAEGRGYDFLSRYFGPWAGISEDHVTGSAHTILAGYWSRQLDKSEFYARQCSSRGGDIHLRVAGDRVHLAGNAVIIMSGTLEI